jgi:hypothetical protein
MLRFECKGQAGISGQSTLFLAANAGGGLINISWLSRTLRLLLAIASAQWLGLSGIS